MNTKQVIEVEGRQLSLTNLEKVLYPDAEFTKAHVLDYYMRVAKWLLPHFAHRPVTMLRYPDGIHGRAFYEKDAPKYTPPWVKTVSVPRLKGGLDIQYICIDDLPTLAWVANLASLELHPFLHKEDVTTPMSVVFDLDPGEGATLRTCADVASRLREILQVHGLECFAKVSGSKGLQIYVPLNTPTDYASTRSFARSVAQILEREQPQRVVSEMAKHLRPGKVFIDWSQNSDFKTTIGVYSLRAKNEVPLVPVPVTWEEVDDLRNKADLEKVRFSPTDTLARLESKGNLFAPLLKMKQTLPNLDPKPKVMGGEGRAHPRTSSRNRTVPEPTAERAKAEDLESFSRVSAQFVEPMLLLATAKLPEGPQWLYELKLDGYRALAIKATGKARLRSRNDKDFTARYPDIAEALNPLFDNTIWTAR